MKKRKLNNIEELQQKSFMQECSHYPSVYSFLFHVPNGGSRNIIEAKKLKSLGVRAGVPDIFYMKPRQGYHALVLEFKSSTKAVVSKEQKEWIKRLHVEDYFVKVVYSAQEAIEIIKWYDPDSFVMSM